MVYTILISIVFTAEIIIAIAVLQGLFKLDKKIFNLNKTLNETNPSIIDICCLTRKISEQCVELAQDYVDKIKKDSENILFRQLSKLLAWLFVINLNFKIVKKMRKSKITKTIVKGWSLLENMV